MENCPRLSVRPTRSKGNVVNAESAKLACNPTSTPFTGSKFDASSNVPAMAIESSSAPVENV